MRIDQPMTPEEIAESCEATAALLEGHWTKGAWARQQADDHEGFVTFYCVEGALAAALGLNAEDLAEGSDTRELLTECDVYQAVLKTVQETNYQHDLMNWNDTFVNEEQEVLDVLHATAKRVLGVPRDDA